MLIAVFSVLGFLGFIYLAAHYNFWRPKISKIHPRILMYHSINDEVGQNHPDLVVRPEQFKAQLNYLKKHHYHFVTMAELIAGKYDGQPRVALTFDDGFQDNYSCMFSLLKAFQAKATIYLCPEMPNIDKLTREQICEMDASGLVEFGAHTLHHVNLSQISDDIVEYEINESKKLVESIIDQPCKAFAYPFGRLNDNVATAVEKAGFDSAVVVKKGIESIRDQYRIKRISVLGKTNLIQFHIAMTRGRYRV